MCHYNRVFRPFAGQANVSNHVFRREQVRKRLGSKLEEKRKVKLAKLKYRIYLCHFEKVGLTRQMWGGAGPKPWFLRNSPKACVPRDTLILSRDDVFGWNGRFRSVAFQNIKKNPNRQFSKKLWPVKVGDKIENPEAIEGFIVLLLRNRAKNCPNCQKLQNFWEFF